LRWIKGFSLLERGDVSSASRELQLGVDLARLAGSQYDVALCAIGLTRCGHPNAQEADVDRVLENLGVVGLPVPPPRR
jgi:hypothetical protein